MTLDTGILPDDDLRVVVAAPFYPSILLSPASSR